MLRVGPTPASGSLAAGPARPAPSLIAARYALETRIGEGGMGEVYAAVDTRSGGRVALKIVHRDDATARRIERLRREAQAAARIAHAGVARVLDAGEDDAAGVAFVAQELVRGETLRARLNRTGRMREPLALAIASSLAEILAAAHDAGVVHRDLKPENVILEGDDDTPRPRLIDFGVARLLLDESAAKLTSTGAALGTPAYMSPEQARGEEGVDEQSDIWALGVVLYEMLTGRAPFARATAHATLASVLLDAVPPLRPHAPEVSEDIARAVERALHRNRVDRWGTMREFHEALCGGARSSPERQRRRSVTAAAVVAVAALLATITWRTPRAPRTVAPGARATSHALATPRSVAPVHGAARVHPNEPPAAPAPATTPPRGATSARTPATRRPRVRPRPPEPEALSLRRTNGSPILGL